MNVILEITELIRTAIPIFAAIGTITSIIGFWRIFKKWNVPGILSLIPFVRSWIFSKDSNFWIKLFYSLSDGFIMILTPIFYYIRAYGELKPVKIYGITFYLDTPMLIVVIIWAILEIIKFISYALVTNKIVIKNNQKKIWVLAWILIPKITKIIWGFSNKFIKNENKKEKNLY